MEGLTIALPVQLRDGERALWDSPDGALLLAALGAELRALSLQHRVVVLGDPAALPPWAGGLGLPVQPVAAEDGPESPLLPPGGLAALRALRADGLAGEAPVALLDFRSALLTRQTVQSALDGLAGDGRARISVTQAVLNTAIVECPYEILAAGTLALLDDEAQGPALPAAVAEQLAGQLTGQPTDQFTESARLSRPFHLDLQAMNWTGYPLSDTPWYAVVTAWYMESFMPEILPAERLGLAKYAQSRLHAVLVRENGSQARRLFSEISLPAVSPPGDAAFRGMDALWNADECSLLCLRRAGRDELWLHESLCLPGALAGARLRAWSYCAADGSLRQCPAASPAVSGAAGRVDFHGRVFLGPVLEVASGADAVVWRLERPATGVRADFLESVQLRRDLWDLSPATGTKVSRENGEAITGRQGYPENLTPTGGLALGRLADLLELEGLGRAGGLCGLRLAGGEAVVVTGLSALLRARNALEGAATSRATGRGHDQMV